MPKAVVLFSGGLDSLVTLHFLRSLGVDVAPLNVVTPFHDVSEVARQRAEQYGFEFHVRRTGEEYPELVVSPKWGYGCALNPCIDCRVRMCQIAKDFMKEIGADFVATGEIAGQRPNSQKQHQLALIARESGLDGYLVRPLSAQVLLPTKAETEGLLDREKLMKFCGRGRGKLIRLAQTFGIKDIPQPASGCLLCEKTFVPRVRDTIRHNPKPSSWDFEILRFGRVLRLDNEVHCLIARRLADCQGLAELFTRKDRSPCVLLEPENFNGPALLMVGPMGNHHLSLAGALVLRFSKPDKFDPASALVRFRDDRTDQVITIFPSEEADQFAYF